jgi:hypothetical protein
MKIFGAISGDGVAMANKCLFSQETESGQLNVIGYLKSGELNLSNEWITPFEGLGLNSATSALIQSGTGLTTKTQLSKELVWDGTNPIDINLEVGFIAFTDAKAEVDDALNALLAMSSPQLNAKLPVSFNLEDIGRSPLNVALRVGDRFTLIGVINSVSYDLAAPKVKGGFFAYNTANINFTAREVINRANLTP